MINHNHKNVMNRLFLSYFLVYDIKCLFRQLDLVAGVHVYSAVCTRVLPDQEPVSQHSRAFEACSTGIVVQCRDAMCYRTRIYHKVVCLRSLSENIYMLSEFYPYFFVYIYEIWTHIMSFYSLQRNHKYILDLSMTTEISA